MITTEHKLENDFVNTMNKTYPVRNKCQREYIVEIQKDLEGSAELKKLKHKYFYK